MIYEVSLKIQWSKMEDDSNIFVDGIISEYEKMESRIFNVDMLLITFLFINIVIAVIFFSINYQKIVDYNRKKKGVKFKPLLALETKKDSKNNEEQL
jgi:predicted membrane protein